MPEKNELTASEAIFGFCGWLTAREEKTIMSNSNDWVPIADLIDLFCQANGLPIPEKEWCLNFIVPNEPTKKEKTEGFSIPGDEEAIDYAGG